MTKKVYEQNRHLREDGGARDSELGEVIRWTKADKQALVQRYDLDHKDPDQARKNEDRFKRSKDFRKVSTYKRKYF